MKKILNIMVILVIIFCSFSGCNGNNENKKVVPFELISSREIELNIGEEKPIIINRFESCVGEILYTSSNEQCVSVTEDGILCGVSKGHATIMIINGDYMDYISVECFGASFEMQLFVDQGYISINEIANLTVEFYPAEFTTDYEIVAVSGSENTLLNKNQVIGVVSGCATEYQAISGDVKSNIVKITVRNDDENNNENIVFPTEITISVSNNTLRIGESSNLSYLLKPENAQGKVEYTIISGADNIKIEGNKVTSFNGKTAKIQGVVGNVKSNIITINADFTEDPYDKITEQEFYLNYQPASSYMDAYYRTRHNFISGDISSQDQKPSVSSYQPKENGKFVKNEKSNYSLDRNTYYVVDSYGNIVNAVYRGGAYITLEDISAYIYAFGDVPANYTESKNMKPSSSKWGRHLRLNHSLFSGDTHKYPFEPKLPDISGCGGKLKYYEIDIGTTGTDCSSDYPVKIYNDGRTITRGAARIVYSRFDRNGNKFTDIDGKYLFYTYNHYNDFQEYLNYQGGWGEMFGNITGGGKLSSKHDYNPTPYVEVVLKDLTSMPVLDSYGFSNFSICEIEYVYDKNIFA